MTKHQKFKVLILAFVIGVLVGQGINMYIIFEHIRHGLTSPLFIGVETIITLVTALYVYWIVEVLKD